MATMTRPSSSFTGLLIQNLQFTDRKLGRGADATVYEVNWNGTPCAAKRLHEILLVEDSPGGADKFIRNFEAECITWSKLRHPGVVQFLGVYLERNSRLPVLVLEKMDISLRRYFEDHSKEEFTLHLKAFVLRQICQALAYLHGQSQPLVHHDLSPNNVLMNVVSFVTKVSDFGMNRALRASSVGQKATIKSTWTFGAPEALQNPTQCDEKLDVFSFGDLILSTLTHEWPNPSNPTVYDGEQLKALNELERRDHHIVLLSAQEKDLFLPTVRQCLENRPDKRPSSAVLVPEMKLIESSLSDGSHVATPIDQLCQRLSAKEEECRQKDETIRQMRDTLKGKDAAIDRLQKLYDTKQQACPEVESILSPPVRDWKEIGKCQRIIKHCAAGGAYNAVAVSKDGLLAVTDNANVCVHLMTVNGLLVRSGIGKSHLSSYLPGVAFDEKGDIWIANPNFNSILKHSQDGHQLLCITKLGQECLSAPTTITVSGNGCLYVCDLGNHRVSSFDSNGKFLFSFGGKPKDCKALDCSSNSLYIYDPVNNRIGKYQEDGTFVHDFTCKGTDSLVHIAPTNDGHLIVSSLNSSKVIVYTTEGEPVCEFGSDGVEPGQFGGSVSNVAVDSAGRVYAVDYHRKRIQVF